MFPFVELEAIGRVGAYLNGSLLRRIKSAFDRVEALIQCERELNRLVDCSVNLNKNRIGVELNTFETLRRNGHKF